MARMAEYMGRRDPRFVAVHRGGLLDGGHHSLLASWAADCAVSVLVGHVVSPEAADAPSVGRLKAIITCKYRTTNQD